MKKKGRNERAADDDDGLETKEAYLIWAKS